MGCPSQVELGDTLVFSITTHDPDTGILTDAAAVPDYWIYEGETGVSINANTPDADVMAKLDDAHTTGFYTESIVCSSVNGYEVGKTYTVYIEATVDGDKGGIAYAFNVTNIRAAQTSANPTGHSATANNETLNTTLDGGTYADTATNDGVNYYQTGPGVAVGGFGLNCDLTFNIGTGRAPSTVIVDGHFDSGAQRTVQVWAYNYFTAAYVQLSNSVTDFGNSGTDAQFTYPMTTEMVKVVDGEVNIRFTSTSVTITDVWNCDYVRVNSVAQESAGLTANAIQQAVWGRSTSGHDEDTLGYNVGHINILNGNISSATDASQFIIDAGVNANDAYNGMIIMLEDKTDDHYEVRRIVDYIGATNEVFVDRAFGFTPVSGDDYYIMATGYSDVNITHINESETASTNIALSAGTIVPGTVSHDNTAASTTVFYCDDITTAAADHYNGRIIIFTSGTLQYQATDITDYEVSGGEGKFTVTAVTSAPADDATFIIV